MGLKDRLKEAARAGLERVEAFGSVDPESLTPAERERVAAWEAHTEAARRGEPVPDGRLVGKALLGPAGAVVHGIEKAPAAPPPLEDFTAWTREAARERAVRDAARVPYLAPEREPVVIERLATRGRTQAADVVAQLAAGGLAARPDLVYGLYRVPDRIDGGSGSESGRLVEWDVVHAAEVPLPPAAPPADVFLDAGRQWVARRAREPRVLDEELALAYLAHAGLGPEQTLGVARHCTIEMRASVDEHADWMEARIDGVHVFHAGEARPWASAAPFTLPPGAPAGVHLEVLNWDAIAVAVNPVRVERPVVPSPHPYLPLTAQELLQAHLEVVGIRPADCYAAQVTYDRPSDLMSRSSHRTGVRKNTGGPADVSADGQEHRRLRGGAHVVVAYRDAPAYAAGRERWAAYEREVLHTALARQLGLRAPVPKPDGRLQRTIDGAMKVAAVFDSDLLHNADPAPPRYCWPPVP